jgi:hypothetical protein
VVRIDAAQQAAVLAQQAPEPIYNHNLNIARFYPTVPNAVNLWRIVSNTKRKL